MVAHIKILDTFSLNFYNNYSIKGASKDIKKGGNKYGNEEDNCKS
jgi:hypothetical protein